MAEISVRRAWYPAAWAAGATAPCVMLLHGAVSCHAGPAQQHPAVAIKKLKTNYYIKMKVCCLFRRDNRIHKKLHNNHTHFSLLALWLGSDISDLKGNFPKIQ